MAAPGMLTDPLNTAEPTRKIVEWLRAPTSGDIGLEVLQLERQLDELHGATLGSQQFLQCIELFASRAWRIASLHREALRHQALPLPSSVLTRGRGIADALQRIALGFERVISDPDARANLPRKRFDEATAARALRLLAENLLVMAQAGLDPDPETWRLAWRLYALGHQPTALEPAANPQETVLFAYKRLLAVPTLAPNELAPAELDWAADFLGRITGLVHVQETRPPSLEGAWYWLDPAGTAEPQACVRREAPEGRELLYFSTAGLARRASELLLRQATPGEAPELGTSPDFPGVTPHALLEKLHTRWSSPPRREQARRRMDYPVQACVGLSAIWNTLRYGNDSDLITEWSVLNESPGGYAIMNVQGRAAGLQAGMAVALRRDPNDPWNLCVVRWIRSDAINQIEIGLQMLSRGAIPVHIGFRGSEREAGMVRALVLPVLPALRQHQAVMAPAGTYASRRFTLVSDVDRVYVAQCRLLSLDLQTSGVELFQFEIDPYPI